MRKKTSKDVLHLVNSFQTFIKNRPTVGQMYLEIQMMKFKIRPIRGDMSLVDLKNEKFIETIWSLGKLDEFFQKEYGGLSRKNKEVFTQIFDDLYHKYQDELNKINIYKGRKITPQNQSLEIEIFKENQASKKIN